MLQPVLSPLHEQTPYVRDLSTSRKIRRSVYLKMECFQPTGSFKIRGIGLLCQRLLSAGKKRLVSSSVGNAGFATAYAGRLLGMPVTMVLPEDTTDERRNRLIEQGARIIEVGRSREEAGKWAREFASSEHASYIAPFDDPILWEGHATMVDEIAREHPKPDVLVLSVGGGGLLCGILEGLHRNHWNEVRVVAVETKGADSLYESVQAGHLITLPAISSIAESLGAARVAQRALDWTKQHPVESVVVSDREAVHACLRIAETHRVLVEPACGASLSIAHQNHPSLTEAKTVAVIVCGGISTSVGQLRQWAEDVK